jgi:ADP-heptose:LPS heptosyltransferase
MKHILVIKLGALGDMFIATSAFEAIRNHHKHAHLTLLTTKPYKDFAEQLGYFDDVWLDDRPKLRRLRSVWDLRKKLRSKSFDRVYDLQMVDRTNFYFHLLGPGRRPEWVGTALGASHRYHLPKLPIYHQDRLKNLLARADINSLSPLNLTRLTKDIQAFPVKFPYVLFAPGASKAHRQTKCWPLDRYAEVATTLVKAGLTPVIVGGSDEDNRFITNKCPEAIDLTGKTQLTDLVTLATHAAFAIGNDTGPMHIAATCLCPVLVMFFEAHDPTAVGPRGVFYRHLKAQDKTALPSTTVLQILPEFIENFKDRRFTPLDF